MEIECDLASIRDEDLLRKMWQQSEDFGRKKEIRSHLYKLRESRLREFYSTGGPGGGDIMNPSSDLCFGKTPLTPSHGDSLVDQSFQSLKSKEVRDSESPLRDIKFRNSGGVAGGVLVPDTTGWNVQTSSEVSPDGRAFRTETLAKTDGVEKIPGGRAEFAGRNEQKSSASHQGDDKNYVKKAAESSKTHLQENIVVGDANSGRTEVKSSSVTSSSSKVVSSSSQVISSGDPGFDMEPRRLTHDPQFQKLVSSANNTALHSDQQQYQRSERNERNERNETTSNLREESLKYVDMDKASPEYQQHVQHLMSQPGAIVSNIVEYPKPGVKMITTVKKLPDGTTVKTKRYETEASADSGSISQTMNQQQRMSSSSSTTQKTTEKRIQDSEDVFSRLSRTRDSSAPMSPQKTPETPSQDDIYSRLQKSRGGNVHEQTFSEAMDQRSTQILRDTNQHPVTRTVPTRRASDLVDNVEVVSTNNTVKKDLNQSVRNEKITDFIQTERDRFVLDRESPSRSGPDGLLNTLAPITPGRFVRPQTEDISTNGYTSTGVVQQSSKSSTKFSESRRFSTETVESFAESHNENQDFSTHGFPSVRRPIEEPKGGRSPSGGRPSQDFSTHGFPSVRPDKPTQQYTSQRPSTNEEYSTTERVHIVNTDRPRPGEAYPQTKDSTSTTRSNFSTNETRRHITSTTDDFSTHGFPSVRAGTPTRDSPKRFEPSLSESPRRPSGQEPVGNRRSPSDGYSTHGFPSVKASSPSGESPRRPSGAEPTNQGQRPTTDDYSTHGFPSAKPGHTTPTQSAPQYEDSPRPTNRRQPSVDRDDTISVSSDRSNSITYEKRIDAAHQAFARSLRCASPVESIRRDSISDRTTPRTSVGSIRNSYSPSKRDGRSPSHESITNSESSRISSATVTKTHRPVTTDTRRVSGPKSPISKTVPSRVSNETIDYSLTRKITAKPTDKTTGRPTPVNEQSISAEPILRKKIFVATEGFLESEGIAEEPILKKEQYYQLGPSDATLPSSRLKNRQLLGTTPNTSRRPYNTEEEINTLLDTATKHTTPTTRSAKTQDTKPTKTDTLYSSKPKTKPEGYISQNRATDITEKHNQTTNKQVSYPHYIPSVPKADRSSPSDRPTKNASSPAPTTTSTTPHTAPKSATEKPKVAPSTSPTTKPSSSSPSTRFTKTVKDENAITRDTTKTRREPEAEYLPEDLDEGYVPDTKGQRRPTSKRPTSDDEGFEPESPRAGSPTSDFEYRRPTQTETFDEEDSIFNRTRKTDKKTVTTDFLDTERRVKQTRRPEDGDRPAGPTDSEPEDGGRKPSYLTNEPTSPSAVKQPRHPGDKEPKRPEEISPKPTHANRVPNGPSGVKQPIHPGDVEPVGPSGPSANEPKRPNDGGRKPHYLTDEPSGTHINQPRHPGDVNKQKRPEDKGRTPLYDEHTCGEPKRPEDGQQPGKPRGSKPPLDRSETFDERCRQILGMQDETTVEKASRVQDFINTERNTVNIIRKPGQRSPSPQKKQPSDTVSIEDCDDEDYPSQNTTTRTTKTTKVEYPRGTSPTEKPVGRGSKPGDKETGDYPRDRSPLGKTPKGIRPSETDETTVTTTTTTRSVDRPRGGSPLGPRGRSPPHSETTVRKTTIRDTNIVDEIDERSPSSRPRDGSPMDKKPIGTRPTDEPTTTTTTTTSNTTYEADRPFSKSPLKKPVRGSSPTDETFTSRTTTRDTTIQESVDDVFGLSRPRDRFSPDEPRDRSPTDETTVRRTTTTKTRGTTDDDRSPHRRDYPRERSPRDTPRGGSPTNDTTVKRTTKSTRDTTIIADIEDRSPSSRPRGQSPNEKPRGRSPINDNTYRTITTTTRDILIDDDSLRPRDYTRDRSPIEKLRGPSPTDNRAMKNTTKTTKTTTVISDVDKRPHGRSPSPTRGPRPTYVDDIVTETTTTSDKIVRPPGRSPTESDTKDGPHNQSPSDKPRRQTPFVSENIDETYVQKTSNTIKGTTTLKEFDVDDTSPHKKPTRRPSPTEETGDHPRGKSPVKPKGGRQYEAYETTVTDVTVVDERNKRPSDRSPSPRSKLTDKYPRGSRPTEEEKSPRNKSPEKKPTSSLRDTSPSEKPRRKYPNDGDTEETIVQMTSKTTDKRTFEETDVENYPRTKSPSEKPKGRRPSGETINDRSPKGSPRGTSPTEKPRRRQQTDEEIDITVIQRTTKTTKEETTDQSPKERYPQNRPRETSPSEKPTPKDYPRDKSPTEKPRGTRPSNETVTQRTLKKTTDISTVDNRSPKTSPRGSSPTEKPRRHQPNDEKIDTTLVQKTSKITRDNRTLEETVVKDRSLKDYPREKSPRRRQPSEEDTDDTITSDCNSPISRPRGTSSSNKPRRRHPSEEETDETFVQTTIKTTIVDDHSRETSPSAKPRERQPIGEEPNESTNKSPKDHPRERSPSKISTTEKPRGPISTDETFVQKTVKTTTDRITTADRSPKDRPRGISPTEKPRRRQPTDEEIDVTVVQKTTKTTRDRTTLEKSPSRSPKEHPRDRSPSERPKGPRATDENVVQRTTKTTTVEDRSSKGPRGTSPSEKPRGPRTTNKTILRRTVKSSTDHTTVEDRPSEDETDEIDETIDETTTTESVLLKDRPRGTSPSEKPRRHLPTDEDTEETVVHRTFKTTRDRTTMEEVNIEDSPRDRSPSESPRGHRPMTDDCSPRNQPRETSPSEKPRRRQPTDEEIDFTVLQMTTKTTKDKTTLEETTGRSPKDRPREKSPLQKPGLYPRDNSPTEKPRGLRPTSETVVQRTTKTTTDRTTVDDRSPKDRPRAASPSQKPVRRQPTNEEIDVTVVQMSTKTTKDRTTLEETTGRSPKDRPREKSPSQKPGSYPRGNSPTEKPRGPRLTSDTVVQRTTKTTTDRTTVDDRSPKDRPRAASPSQKPVRRQPTDEEIDVTVVQMSTKTTNDRTTLEETTGRSPKDRPREKSPTQKPGSYPRNNSPTDKPRGPRPTSETVVQRTTETTTDRTTVDDRSPKDRPRGTSPSQKPVRRQPTNEEIDVTVVQMSTKTTKDRTTLEETTGRSPKDRPREKSPSQKPGSYPRDNSPTEKPRGPRPTSETVVQRTTKTTTDRTIVDDRSPKDRPRGISHSEKPRSHRPSEDETDETDEIDETINEITTTERVLLKDRPRGTSPSEKPRRRHPTDEDTEETIVRRTTVTRDRTTMEEVNIEDSPRDRSPSESPRGRRPTTDDCSPRNQPRETSPSEKPRRRQPTVEEIDVTVLQRATKTTNDRTTLEETTDRSPKDRPREKSQSQKPGSYPRDNSPTEKPRGPRRTSETVVQRTTKTTTDRTTVDDRLPKDLPRATSPSEKPRRRQPTEEEIDVTMVQRTTKTTKDRTTLEKKRDRLPAEKPGSRTYPRDNSPTENHRSPMPTRETVIQRNVKTTTDSITVDDHSPDNRYRGTSPSEKPWERRPSEEETEEAITETSIETTTFEGERPRPHDQSSTEKPNSRTYPHETAPLRKPQRPTNGEIDETVILTTFTTRQGPTFDDRHPEGRPVSPSGKPRGPNGSPRGTSPSDKPRRYLPSDDEIDETYVRRTTKTTREDHTHEGSPTSKPSSKPYPRDDSPTDKLRRPKTTDVDETTVRNTTTRTTVQETDFEKRYPKGREQSPVGKPTTRRPSKPTTTTTTTRNRSTLEEQDLSRSPRPKTQPATRDKAPTKTISTYPRSQPTTERRVPAELPSLGRKPVPKTTFGSTTKTTTQTTVTRVPATRPKTTKEMPKKPSKLVSGPSELRPGARQPERKHSPSISPDSSPSRPTSEVDLQSPYRSPNTSPSRKSPSPTRSVKLEDITSSVVTTKKTTVSIDKSKPKITHTTTAKFQVSPPTSPTKVISSSEIKYSPSKKPPTKATTPKPTVSRVTTTKKSTTVRKDVVIPTDSERDSEVPTDLEDVDSPLAQKSPTRKLPVTHRKESAPVHRVTQIDRDVQKMARSTSENIIKTPVIKRPLKNEPLEPISQGKTSPKTERRPSKHLSTKTINLTTFDKVINSQDMEDVMVIDIQHAKSSREPSPNKIVPTPVSVDLYTGKPRYPDVVQEPEDEPRKKPTVKNIPIFEEETNDFVGCQITEVNESFENTTKHRTRKFIDGETRPQRPTPIIVTGDNVDNECLLSVHDKVSKFISTAEEVSRPKTSAPFRRDVPEEDIPDDDECLLTVDEKVNKFLKTAESVTKEVMTSSPKPIERPRIDDLDEDLRTDECVLSVSEKVNKFTTKAEKLAPSAPQRSPELVARIERQISRQSEPEPESPRDVRGYPESPDGDDSPTTVRKVKQTKSLFEREEKKYTDRQIDILSRPSVWDKKPKPEVNLNDILGYKPDDERVEETPRRKSPIKDQPDVAFSKPSKPLTDTISKRKEVFENKTSTHKITSTTKPGPHSPTYSRKPYKPSDESDSQYPSEFPVKYVDGYPQEPDDVHEDVYGSSKTRCLNETSTFETTRTRQSPERSPTRKSSHPEIRPSPRTSTRTPKQPEDHSPSRRYSDDHSPRHSTDLYTKTSETSEYTTRRRSSTQKYPEDHSPKRRTPHDNTPSPSRKQPVDEPEDYTFSSMREETNKHHTTRTSYRSPKDTTPLTPTSIPDDEDHDHSPARSTSTVSSQKRTTTHRSTTNRLTEDTTSRRPRRPSGNEPSTPTSLGRGPKSKGVPETVAARRNIFESSPGDVSPKLGNRRPSYMDHTKSSLEHTRKDSLEITKTNYSRKSSMEEEPYEPSPRSAVKFGVGLKHKDEPKPKRKLSSSDIPNIEDVFELDLLEEMLNIVTLYEQRRRIRAQIRVVKKLLETKTKEEVSKMTKITTFRKTSSSSISDSPIPRRDTSMRPDRYQPSDDIDSESIVESRHVEEHEEIIRERSISPQTKTTKKITKVTEVRRIGEPTTSKRTAPKKDEPKDSKPIWATKNILKKPSENEKVARVLSAKKTTSTSSSSTSRTQQSHRQRVPVDEDCITSSYGIGPTDDDGRPLFGIRALKKKATTTSKTAQPSETTKVTGTVITEKYYSENGAKPVGERKVTVYSTNPEDLVDMETQYDRRDSETVKRERLSKDGLTSVTKVQKIGKYKPGEIPALTDDDEFGKTTSKMVRRGSVKEMSEKFIRKESSSSVTEKSSGYPKAGLILRTRTNSGATADAADQYEVRAKSTEYDDESENECDVEIRTSRKHSKVVTESEDETEIRRKVNTRSFLNSGGSKVTGVDDVLDRMRNADNVVVDGDTLEDREARSLLNKFLGASVLMTGMESIIPQRDLKRTTAGDDHFKKQGVKTTRVTKTTKSAAVGGSSSSPVARETCDFEEIWDEETLKELLEKSTSYEERRSIRARLRQLMADREACAELVASVKAELDTEKNVKTDTIADDESSCSEYEEIIEEYTASESEEDEATTTTTKTAINTAAKKKEEVKDETKIKKITEEVQKTTLTKKQEPPKQTETKKNIVVEKTTITKKDATPSSVEDKKLDTKPNTDDDNEASVSDNSKGESLLIPLLQGLLHKNMPQARSSSSTSKTATATTTTTAIANQNSNNLKSSLKNNNKHLSSTSSNNNNSLGDSGLSSEVSKNSSLGQGGSSLRVTAQQIEDSGTESGEDLRLIAAGIRDSMQIEGIEDQSDMSLIKEVTNALNRLESSLKEGNDLSLDNGKKNALLALVERLQTGLTAPHKLSEAAGEPDFPDETSSPEADNHRSNRQRFAKRRNRNNRHTVGVSKEELADARRYMEEMVMIENLSNCTTPECNAATTPPQFFAIQKQQSMGAILSNHDSQEVASSLFRPNQFVPSNLQYSTQAGSSYPDVQLRQKKGTTASGQRQSAAGLEHMTVEQPDSSSGKRPLSDSYDSYSAQNSRVTFSDTKQQNESYVQDKNQYNRKQHTDNQPDLINRMSPDSTRFNRFNNKKQMMKRANTIDIPKTHRYNPEFDTDSEFEDKSSFNVKGLRGTVQVSVKRKPRQVVPNFEPKTENDHKFLAFIQKQNATPGLGWNSSKSVSNWTNKFGNIKNVFESGVSASNSNSNRSQVPSGQGSSAKNFWKKADEHNPPKVSTSVLTSALKAKERNEQRSDVVVPKPIHMNQFIHNPQSAFRPIDISPEATHLQFKPIPVERPVNIVNRFSPTKSYNSVSSRKQAVESPNYPHSPTKSWVKKNTATNSPVTLPWAVKPPENSVLKMAASKFESKSPLSAVQRHHSFKEQIAQKRPSLPNAAQPYQYQYDGYSQPNYTSNSQPASYAEYVIPRVVREDSLTNPHAEPLVLTPNKPAYSPHSLQPFDYYAEALNSNFPQTDMTDDDIDDLESMTEYRVEAKVMGKPVSQQAVTVGKRTAHVSDDEVFGKNSRAAKSLLSVMKNIGNGGAEKVSKKVERNIAPSTCMSPDGRAYQAPIVEPLFPEVTKFEVNRVPEYIGPKPHQSQQQQQNVEYQKNPAYVPLVDYHDQQPPVAPPRGRKVSQETKSFPQERPNVHPQPRREAPSSLPLQGGPTSPPTYVYSSPLKTPESAPYTSQVITDSMFMENGPNFRQQYSGPSTPDDYSSSREAYQSMPTPRAHPAQTQYNQTPKGYPGPQPVVNLPQIPLETSFTKVYDKPRDVVPYYKPTEQYQTAPITLSQAQRSPKIQQSPQPLAFAPQQVYQTRTEVPPQYYHSPKIQQSPQSPPEIPEMYYQSSNVQQGPQSPRDIPPQFYQSPKIQQSLQSPTFTPQPTYQPKTEVPPQYYQSPSVQQSRQSPQYYQSPKIQQSSQAPAFAPQRGYQPQAEVPTSFYQSPKAQQSSQPPVFVPQQMEDLPQFYQSPKIQQSQQQPAFTEAPVQQYQSPKVQPSSQPPSFIPKTETTSQKSQQSPQPLTTLNPRASKVKQASRPVAQPKPQAPPKNENITRSSQSQHTSSTFTQQQHQTTVAPSSSANQPMPINNAVLCKQASLDGRKRVQSQSQLYEKVEEVRRKSLGNVLEITRLEREAREQKAAAIKQDMYSVQQDVYSQKVKAEQKTEIHQQESRVYKSSAPDDTPDIVKSSLAKDDIPILKKFGPPQRHCYIPNAYQNPLTKSETTVSTQSPKSNQRKFSEPSVTRGPVIVEIPATPQPDSQDEIPRNIVFNNVSAFTSMSHRFGESSTEYTSQQNRPNKLNKCDSWHQICQLQNAAKPPSPKFNNTGTTNALRRSKSGHTLALPKLYEAGYDRTQISEKQKTVAAYFTGQKSPNSLSRNSSQTNLADETTTVSVKKSSINRIRTSEKASISKQNPSSGLSRSHTMPHIPNVSLLDESNVEDAFEQLMNGLSTTTTEKTETKKEDGGVVTTTTKVTTRTITGAPKPVSPFAKFQQLDKQSSLQSPKSPLTPTTPGGSSSTPIFRFTDPALNARAATVKDQLLQWCQSKTQEYENVQITNFSASWTDGLAFCALIHHFLPDAFDYSKLTPKQRRYNFELAFRVADEKAGIAPLLDVEDMVVMKRPDWKCVFTYVQSIYRRFRNCQ